MSEFLKCDAEGCDHREDVGRITAEMVGKECPKCGSNLLTKSDWDVYSSFQAGMDALEAAGIKLRADAGTPEDGRVSVNYHDGQINIRLPNALTSHSKEGEQG